MIMETVALFDELKLLSMSESIYCVKIVGIEGILNNFSFQLPIFA